MPARGVAVAVVTIALIGAAVLGYTYLIPASQQPSSSRTQPPPTSSSSGSTFTASANQGGLEISSAGLSDGGLSLVVQNLGSQPVSIDSLLVAPGSGCNETTTTSTTTNQTRVPLFASSCLRGGLAFLIESNSTLRPISTTAFNFTSFNSTSFARTFSGNVTRTFTGNFSRTITGNFTAPPPGNFSRSISGNFTGPFPGNFTGFSNLNGTGFQLAAGQSVTLTYDGTLVTGLSSGSQYTIMVAGQQAEAEITIIVG